jgi:hypothetical protein
MLPSFLICRLEDRSIDNHIGVPTAALVASPKIMARRPALDLLTPGLLQWVGFPGEDEFEQIKSLEGLPGVMTAGET